MALELAANFLGTEASDPVAAAGADDSFKELLNVVCGHLLTAMAGEDPVFDLTMPTVIPLPAGEAGVLQASAEWIPFQVEGHPVRLHVRVEGDWRPMGRQTGKGGV
jgi:CheY-specific phosphatase CheX